MSETIKYIIIWIVIVLLLQFLINEWLNYFHICEISIFQTMGILIIPSILILQYRAIIKGNKL